MDRLTRVLPPRFVIPLVGMALAGLPWLLPWPKGAPHADPQAPPSVYVADATPANLPGRPGLLPIKDGARPLEADDGGGQLVLAAFPNRSEKSPPTADGQGPALLAPLPPSLRSDSIKFPVTVDPAPGEADRPGLPELNPSKKAEEKPTPATEASPSSKAQEKPALANDASKPAGEGETNTAPTASAAAPDRPGTLTESPKSLLLLPGAAAARSEQLENIARQADRQIRHGYELAGREAFFAARAEFVAAMRLLAQGLDTDHQTNIHSRALSAGLTAVKEAQDFLPSGTKLEAELDLATMIASHRTPVLKNATMDDLRPLMALRCYFTFAQEQLAASVGHEVSGSMALYALGKLHATMARQKTLDVQAPEPKAIVFYQASLLVYPQNYMASNDLGVLLARCGNAGDARQVLEHSASVSRNSTVLSNLAGVYQQLGEARLATQTRQQAEATRRAEVERRKGANVSADGLVQWIDPGTLARSGTLPADASPALKSSPSTAKPNQAATANANAAPPAGDPSATSPLKSLLGWLPWSQEKPATR